MFYGGSTTLQKVLRNASSPQENGRKTVQIVQDYGSSKVRSIFSTDGSFKIWENSPKRRKYKPKLPPFAHSQVGGSPKRKRHKKNQNEGTFAKTALLQNRPFLGKIHAPIKIKLALPPPPPKNPGFSSRNNQKCQAHIKLAPPYPAPEKRAEKFA